MMGELKYDEAMRKRKLCRNARLDDAKRLSITLQCEIDAQNEILNEKVSPEVEMTDREKTLRVEIINHLKQAKAEVLKTIACIKADI